jgi:hypothetical protein
MPLSLCPVYTGVSFPGVKSTTHISVVSTLKVRGVLHKWPIFAFPDMVLKLRNNFSLLSVDERTGEWRKLHNEELHNLYSSPDIIGQIKSRRMRWAGQVARMGEERKVYRVLVRKPEGKRPLGRPRRRSEDSIRMDLRAIGSGV